MGAAAGRTSEVKGKGQIGSRGRHQAPREAEQTEIVPPMIAIDDGAFAKDTEEGGINGRISLRPRGGDKHELQADKRVMTITAG